MLKSTQHIVGGAVDLSKYLSPIVTSLLTGSVLWVVDSIIFALGMTEVSISGALFADISALRLSIRLLVFLVCLMCGIYSGYRAANGKGAADFRADGLFTDEDYLEVSRDQFFSGDDTLRGFSYVESVSINPEVDVANRPVYFSEHIKKHLQTRVRGAHVEHRAAAASADLLADSFQRIQKNESDLLWQHCGRLGSALRLNIKELAEIRTLCYCYDVGRFPDGATDENHCELGAEILAEIPELAAAADLVRTHHEKWDGSGLLGLSGLDIPLGSRIFAVAWVYNAFTKPYGAWRLSTDDALDMLQMYAGTALDPELVAVFIGLLGQRVAAPGAVFERQAI